MNANKLASDSHQRENAPTGTQARVVHVRGDKNVRDRTTGIAVRAAVEVVCTFRRDSCWIVAPCTVCNCAPVALCRRTAVVKSDVACTAQQRCLVQVWQLILRQGTNALTACVDELQPVADLPISSCACVCMRDRVCGCVCNHARASRERAGGRASERADGRMPGWLE